MSRSGMTNTNSSEQLGQAVVSYGKIVLTIVIALLCFCVWAVPNYLISQREAVAEQRYCTKQEAVDVATKQTEQMEKRINSRLDRMENKLDQIWEHIK